MLLLVSLCACMRDVQNPVSSAAFPAGAQGILVTCDTYFENNAVRQALMLVEEVSFGWYQLSQPLDQKIACAKTSMGQQTLPYGLCVVLTKTRDSLHDTQHYDKLRGTEGGSSAAGGSAGTSGTKDISALLAEEVAELKDRSKQRFKKHDTGVKGCFLVTFPADEGTTVHLGGRGEGVAWMGLAVGTRRSKHGGAAGPRAKALEAAGDVRCVAWYRKAARKQHHVTLAHSSGGAGL